MGGSLNIGSPTIGGGTAFQAILADMLGLISEDTRGRAEVGLGLFGGLLESELSARRRPVSIVDQLLLSDEFGTQLPLSQLPPERSRAFGIREPNPLLGELRDSLGDFATGRDARFEQFWESFANAPRERGGILFGESDPRGRWINSLRFVDMVGVQHVPEIARRVSEAGADELGRRLLRHFSSADTPRQMQAGGTITVVPGQKRTQGDRVAGPVTITDRTGKAVAVAGEGTNPETINVVPQGSEASSQREIPPDLERDVRFRLEEILRRAPFISLQQALSAASTPESFEPFLDSPTDPRTVASRLLGGGLSADLRFTDPFVRALVLGRAPTPSELTARDVTTLSPFNRDILAGVVGEEQFPQFLFELGLLSPTGTQVRQGTVAGLRV